MTEYEYELQVKDSEDDRYINYFGDKTFSSLSRLMEEVARSRHFTAHTDRSTRIKKAPKSEEVMGDEE